MTITDDIVSRRHARFEVRDGRVYIVDEGSMNGTHLRRQGTLQEVTDRPVELEHGDQMYLGHPDELEAVELSFDKTSQTGGE